MREQQGDMEDRIMGLRNSLNAFQEDLIGALSQIRELSSRQRDTQNFLEMVQSQKGNNLDMVQSQKGNNLDMVKSESSREVHSVPHSRRSSKVDLVVTPGMASSHGSNTSTHTSSSEQDSGTHPNGRQSKVWRERDRKGSHDDTDVPRDAPDNAAERQTAALELLESERVYVSHLSLLLKANITFNGTETLHKQDKRPFPSSLRFLIQQHLELLHTLQERVLRSQWQGIMGDVFMRLTSKESDFLDLYVSYLKELPECISVVSMLECDIVGDESRPSLHTLMLQPVLRIPEYLLLLQSLLRITDAEHPDYFLLLVCIQQFRSFISQYSQLLQHNQDLLLLNRKEIKREHASQVKRSKQRLLEQIQSRRYHDWDLHRNQDHPEPQQNPLLHRYDNGDRPSTLPFYPSDGRAGLYETDPGEEEEPSLFDRRSSSASSSNSSIDIAFVRCPKATTSSSSSNHGRLAPQGFSPAGGGGGPGGSQGSGYSKQPSRGCVSPSQAVTTRHHHLQHRPLQVSQRKSKSLNGLQLDSTVVGGGESEQHHHLIRSGLVLVSHAKLERQGSKGFPTPTRRGQSKHRGGETDGQATANDELHSEQGKESGNQQWGEEPNWKGGANDGSHTPFSERSRKQDKGGFRNSFKKLFKKKSSGEGKERTNEKSSSEIQNNDHESGRTRAARLDMDRGTAV
ncbi:uncharacterized protein arhgef33 [Aplochiton taeniatus]